MTHEGSSRYIFRSNRDNKKKPNCNIFISKYNIAIDTVKKFHPSQKTVQLFIFYAKLKIEIAEYLCGVISKIIFNYYLLLYDAIRNIEIDRDSNKFRGY